MVDLRLVLIMGPVKSAFTGPIAYTCTSGISWQLYFFIEIMPKKYYYFLCAKKPAGVAQLVVHFTRNEGVGGSSPLTSTINVWRSTQVRLKGTHSKCVRTGNCRVGSNPTFSVRCLAPPEFCRTSLMGVFLMAS